MLIYTVGFKLGFKASNREGGTSLYLSRQRVHNTVGSLPLAKNALHSLTSTINNGKTNPYVRRRGRGQTHRAQRGPAGGYRLS